jgi:hypothetical protein
MALVRFRWLLCALDQTSDDFLALFEQWRAHRVSAHPAFSGPDLRHYYRTEQFCDDFLRFVRGHELEKAERVAALLDYHEALRLNTHRKEIEPRGSDALPIGTRLRWADIPVLEKHTRVVRLAYDLQLLIDALKRRTEPVWDCGLHFYVAREASPGVDRLHRVSNWVGCLLSACDGQRTIRDVLNQVWQQVPDLEESTREYVLVQLLRGIHAQELIGIYRPCSVARGKRAPKKPRIQAKRFGRVRLSDRRPDAG